MTGPAIAAAVLLALLVPLWSWLDGVPGGNLLNGWLFAAYAVVFAVLGAYRAGVGARKERALYAALAGARPGAPALPPRRALADVWDALALAALGTFLVLALIYAPQEKTMGQLQRIFYLHVPCAWAAGLAYAVVAAASVAYLARRSEAADRVAVASAEVGVVFTSLVLITGPIWAKPAWGIWWAWDARLTTTLLLWLVYIGYLMLRALVDDSERQRRLAAVVGILGLVGVVIDYKAIEWWRTQHPQPVLGGGEGSGLAPPMLRAFLLMLLAMTFVYLALVTRRAEAAAIEARNAEAAAGE